MPVALQMYLVEVGLSGFFWFLLSHLFILIYRGQLKATYKLRTQEHLTKVNPRLDDQHWNTLDPNIPSAFLFYGAFSILFIYPLLDIHTILLPKWAVLLIHGAFSIWNLLSLASLYVWSRDLKKFQNEIQSAMELR